MLVALSARATAGLNARHVEAAVIIEMVHLATLVHDDVVDGAEVRRRRPTLAANWGNKVSVLAGDCLFAEALKLAATFPSPDVCRMLSHTSKVVCTGEIRQTLQRGNFQLSRAEYLEMLSMKTAALFALACELGARLSNADDELTQGALREYGEQLGTAYQIYDDCVDVFGSEEVAGKSLGTDLATGKATLPMLLVLEQANEQERKSWLALFKDGEAQADIVRERLVAAGIPAVCREVVAEIIARAKVALVNLPGPAEPLHDLAGCLTAQLELLGD
jgi:octaprenyl-diphosphate synthase